MSVTDTVASTAAHTEVWYGMVEVCEGAPVAVSGWVLANRHDLAPCAANSLHRATMAWYGMVWYGMVWYGMVWYVRVSATGASRYDMAECLLQVHRRRWATGSAPIGTTDCHGQLSALWCLPRVTLTSIVSWENSVAAEARSLIGQPVLGSPGVVMYVVMYEHGCVDGSTLVSTPMMWYGMVWYGMVEVCEGAPRSWWLYGVPICNQ